MWLGESFRLEKQVEERKALYDAEELMQTVLREAFAVKSEVKEEKRAILNHIHEKHKTNQPGRINLLLLPQGS